MCKIWAGNKSLHNSKTTASLISTGMTYIRTTLIHPVHLNWKKFDSAQKVTLFQIQTGCTDFPPHHYSKQNSSEHTSSVLLLPLRVNNLHHLSVIYFYVIQSITKWSIFEFSFIMTSFHYVWCPSKEKQIIINKPQNWPVMWEYIFGIIQERCF